MPSYIVPYRSTRHSNNNNLTVSMENNESVIRPFGNIMLQNKEVCGNTIYSSSETSGVNHIIH